MSAPLSKILILLIFVVGAALLDSAVRPRRWGPLTQRRVPAFRSIAGMWLQFLILGAVFGLFLGICGNVAVSAALSFALVALFMMVSNAKRAMLGEPLVFSDLALIGAVFKHPQFYMSALQPGQKAALVLAVPVVPVLLWLVFERRLAIHLVGIALVVLCPCLIWLSMRCRPFNGLAPEPDAEADVLRHGLLATILMHWLRWRVTKDPSPPVPRQGAPRHDELALIIQCESFADPVSLFGDSELALPGFEALRDIAWQSGNLEVSGFGAYTMRTEYGVVFGRTEGELGFRRFDPFLTALGEARYALPARLADAGWRSLFAHPHDMRFYNREQIMNAGGFSELVGEDRFAKPSPNQGRYVTDDAIADVLLDIAESATRPTLVYAVTIENHGPWQASAGETSLRDGYLHLVRNSADMLTKLHAGITAMRRPATLVFFGDHRPSIPGFSVPGGARHTPYIVLRYDSEGQPLKSGGGPIDRTPAELHHVILDLLTSPVA